MTGVSGGTVTSTTDISTTLNVPCPGDASLTANYIAPATLNIWNWSDNTFDTNSRLPPLSSFSKNATVISSGIQSTTYLSYTPCFNNFTLTSEVLNSSYNFENIFYNSYCYWDQYGTPNGNVTVDVSMVEDSNTNHWVTTMWADFFQNGQLVNAGDLLNQSYTSNLSYLLDHQQVNGQGGGLIEELSTVGQNYASSSNSTLKSQGVEYEDLSSSLGDFETAVQSNSTILDTVIEGYVALVDDYVPNIVCSAVVGVELGSLIIFPFEAGPAIIAGELASVVGREILVHYATSLPGEYLGCSV
ncbi:MAG TPA: hypothetical protein VJN71_06610 [Nitrososphaerales archaeon]|nr:hypothetical protein [Nitrososphaerales archaeon]